MRTILIIITLTIFLFGCGYSVVNRSTQNNYTITEISTSGEKRINYNIKNKLMLNTSEISNNSLSLILDTKKERKVKDKNTNNEITSYQLSITTNVSYIVLGNVNKDTFTVNQSGDYKVSTQRLNTLNNEKKLIETLTNNIVDQIFNKLRTIVSDN